jgi:hypothetical protein
VPEATPQVDRVAQALRERLNTDSFEAGPGRRDDLLGKVADRLAPTTPKPRVSQDRSGRTVVDLGKGDNQAYISQGRNGGLTISSDGHTVNLTARQAKNVVIRGGEGNDRIIVMDPKVKANLRLEGGNGNDILIGGAGRNTLVGGNGDDYLQGGARADTFEGGAGRDVMYGLGGSDRMRGGADRDYMDGGEGADTLDGGLGNDQVIGGGGDDTLEGGAGDDALVGSRGRDRVSGGAGRDKLYVQGDDFVAGASQAEDTVTTVNLDTRNSAGKPLGSSIKIEGDPVFQARVQSDLDALRALPEGQELLAALDRSGRTTTIKPTGEGSAAIPSDKSEDIHTWLKPDGTPGRGADTDVYYKTTGEWVSRNAEDWQVPPPGAVLFHELVHAYNFSTGTRARGTTENVENSELAATGLPYDHDGDPSTPHQLPGHTSENRFRELLNLPIRKEYY